jgi:chromosome segregation ATPase
VAETLLNQEEQHKQQKPGANKAATQKGEVNFKNMRAWGIGLMITMIGLSAFVLKLQNDNAQTFSQSSDLALSAGVAQASNYRSYVKQYKETKAQLEETTRKLEAVTEQLNTVTAELNTTKVLLAQTQTMLTQATSENNKLKEDIMSIGGTPSQDGSTNITTLEAKVNALKNQNTETDRELRDLKTQLKAFQADFSTLEEGRSLITLFQNKIKLVKSRMRSIAQEAYFAKIAAQKERDRLATLNGNQGFLMQNGEVKKPGNKNFSIDVKMVQ